MNGIKSSILTFLPLILVLVAGASAFYFNFQPLTIEEKFTFLSASNTNQCSGTAFLSGKSDGDYLQGSCCSPMDFHRYSEQVEGLKKFSSTKEIPKDPYDIPVEWANQMIEFQKTIVLNYEQQKIMDEALSISHEGPCCCKCWRWYAYEGLAKFLITEQDFSAEEVAEVWDLSDGCGGAEHHHA